MTSRERLALLRQSLHAGVRVDGLRWLNGWTAAVEQEDCWLLVSFERWRAGETLRVTVEFGIVVKRLLLAARREMAPRRLDEHFTLRIGSFLDGADAWWVIDADADADEVSQVGSTLTEIVNDVAPRARAMASEGYLISAWTSARERLTSLEETWLDQLLA
jgi:hypothetical protein